MGTTARAIAAAVLVAAGIAACDDDNEEIEDQRPPGDTVDEDVPFDPDVPPGVDTDTDETENQGLDPANPESGNNSDLSDDSGLGD